MKKKDIDKGQSSLLKFFIPKQNAKVLEQVDLNAQKEEDLTAIVENECTELQELGPLAASPLKTNSLAAPEVPSTATAASPLSEANEKQVVLDNISPDQDEHRHEIHTSNTCEAAPVPAHHASSVTTVEGGPLAYELEREARIRRNMEVMRSLGLGEGGSASLRIEAPRSKMPRATTQRKRKSPPPVPRGPVRRSSRHRGAVQNTDTTALHTHCEQQESEEEDEIEEVLEFDDSSVKKYVCEVLSLGGGGLATATTLPPPGATVHSFHRLPKLLVDPALSRAYSVDWRPGLVVAGGKNGHVSVWGSRAMENSDPIENNNENEEDEIAPLMSQKLHKGWISDVQFCGGTGIGSEVRLITAGNDGILSLWDITQSATQGQGRREVSQCLGSAKDLHASGIFTMEEVGGRILTGSKDHSVVLSSIDANGVISVVRRWDALHDGVVKCTRWRPLLGASLKNNDGSSNAAESSVFASCGNDGVVRVVDVRAPERAPGAENAGDIVIHGGHSTAVNSVQWSPASEHLLLSASHDPHILLHDLRNPKEALHAFTGHSSAHRLKGIIQPVFVAGGEAVATGGDKGDVLSLYRVSDGTTISRGATDIAIGATYCGAGKGDPLLCTANRCVAFYHPIWE